MSEKKKILVIRFNAIGDVILTSPVTTLLHASSYEVHYVCKSAFAIILEPRPDVTKVWSFKKNLTEIIDDLKQEQFDLIIDLHNNLRSKQVKSALKVKSYTLSKPRINNLLLTQFGINRLDGRHIVDRFLDVLSPLNLKPKHKQLSFYFPDNVVVLNLPKKYVAIAVGAAYFTKQIPLEKLVAVVDGLNCEVVLIGGKDDIENAKTIQSKSSKKIINLVGDIDIPSSGKVIASSSVLITGDTGMMHLSAALSKPVVAIFGSTHPVLGYTPYYGGDSIPHHIIQNENLSCRPCTKQGKDACPKGHFKCMLDLSVQDIIDKTEALV